MISASIKDIRLISFSLRAFICLDNFPSSIETAIFAALSDFALIRSAIASACNKSIFPFKKALSVNSPGLANLAPYIKQASNMLFTTGTLPWG